MIQPFILKAFILGLGSIWSMFHEKKQVILGPHFLVPDFSHYTVLHLEIFWVWVSIWSMFHEKPGTYWVPISRFKVPSFGHNGFALQLENLVSVNFLTIEYFFDSFKNLDSFNVKT